MQLVVVVPSSGPLQLNRPEAQNRIRSGLNRFLDRINRSGPVPIVKLCPPLPGFEVPPRPGSGIRSLVLIVAAEAVVAVGAWNVEALARLS